MFNYPLHDFSYMLDKLMGEEVWLDAKNACTFPKPWISDKEDTFEGAKRKATEEKEEEELMAEEAQRFVGNYSNPVYPLMKLRLLNSKLKVGASKFHQHHCV